MHQPIQNGIGHGGVVDPLVPLAYSFMLASSLMT